MTIRTTEDLAALIKQLRDGGATRIEVKPDGSVTAEFGPRVEYVPTPYPIYPQWPRDILGPWWGIVPPADHQPFTSPTITWSTSSGNNTTITFPGDGDAS